MRLSQSQTAHIIIVAVATLIIAYFMPRHEVSHYKYEQGRPWSYAKLIAPFDIPIHPDSSTVLRARDSLQKVFFPIYKRSDEVVKEMTDSMRALLPSHTAIAAEAILKEYYAKGVLPSVEDRQTYLGRTDSVRFIRDNVVSGRMAAERFNTLEHLQQAIAALANSGNPDTEHVFRVGSVVTFLKPNIVYDEVGSQRMFDQAILPYTSDKGVIQQGQTVIDKGAIVSSQDVINLRTYETLLAGQHSSELHSVLLLALGQLAYVFLLLASLALYLRQFQPDVYADRRSMLSIFLLVTVFFLFAVAMDHFIVNGVYIVPLTIVPILVLVFFDGRTALFTSMVSTLLCAGFAPFTLEFILLQALASSGAVFSLEQQISKRSQLLRTAGIVAGIMWVTYLAAELMLNGSLEGFSWHLFAYLGINALLTSFAYILMFVFEKIFGFVSVVTLVELADINHPLLRELSDHCPGTFQHAMAVSNLASEAAQKIGANVQLVRAGALYHDIGKLSNPAFFTENQSGVNPHEALSPLKSAEIVINHVTDGVRRAEKAKLPREIVDFIREHHGRGKAKYFYFTYCKQHPGEDIDPTPFTYPGPDPKSRETSVMMMADAVEAASRSLKEHTPQAISDLVNKIIDGQIADGLHNDSPLSFRDIKLIKETFIRRLKTMYHSRISYPDDPNKKTDTQTPGAVPAPGAS